MNPPIEKVEKLRLSIQARLDDRKSQAERNKLGQFSTPLSLSVEIMKYAKEIIPKGKRIRFLDPAFGTGSFYSALLQVFDSSQVERAMGFEIDEKYANEAKRLWKGTPLNLKVADFTALDIPSSADSRSNLIICNPPYVRHHHLTVDQKEKLRKMVEEAVGIRLSGLSGLYCYYMLLSHQWLSSGGIAGWLVPSEFMDVNYGLGVKQYLLDRVTLLRIHRFDTMDVQFSDADVSSAVVWLRNAPPPEHHSVEFTQGGMHSNPKASKLIPVEVLRSFPKWSSFPTFAYENSAKSSVKLLDLFQIKRGLATGANEFFIMDKGKATVNKIPPEFLIPILPMPRDLDADEIKADGNGYPLLERQLFLLSCNLPENEVRTKYPNLWAYLKTGIEAGIGKRYLCQHRSPWYSQEERPAAPFLCSYFGRKTSIREKPFRFILNHSKATASNSYLLLYPKNGLKKALDSDPQMHVEVWQNLNEITSEALVSSGRVYGGGLHKLEPKELANVPADNILKERQIELW